MFELGGHPFNSPISPIHLAGFLVDQGQGQIQEFFQGGGGGGGGGGRVKKL